MVMPTRTQQFNSDGTPKLDRNGQPVYTDTTPSGIVASGSELFRDLLNTRVTGNDPNASQGGGPRYRVWQAGRNVLGWEVEVWDMRGGLNATIGDIDTDWDRLSNSTLDSRFYRHLLLPSLVTAATSPDPTGSLAGLHHANIFGTMAIAAGAGADVSLMVETSATDPTVLARTYTPGSAITGLWPIIIGGITTALRLAVGRAGGATQILSDLGSTPTVAATMNAATQVTWGMIQTPLNTMTILIYYDNVIATLNAGSATGDAPTTVLSGIPGGGFALGLLRLGGGALRAYWAIPLQDSTTGILVFGSEAKFKVMSTNLEGVDPQDLDFGLKGLSFAALVPERNAIIASDGERTIFHNGSQKLDTYQFSDRVADTDYEYRGRGFGISGSDVYSKVNRRAATGLSGATEEWAEFFDFDSWTWHRASATTTLSSTGSYGILPSGSFPFSNQNNFLHNYSDGSWRRMWANPAAYNPFNIARKTGSGSGASQEFASSGVATSPVYHLRGLEGLPKVVSEIVFLGQLDEGGTDATALVEVASQAGTAMSFTAPISATFRQRDRWDKHYAYFPDNRAAIDRLQYRVTLTRGSDTRKTPNGLPFLVRGYAYTDRIVRSPTEVLNGQ